MPDRHDLCTVYQWLLANQVIKDSAVAPSPNGNRSGAIGRQAGKRIIAKKREHAAGKFIFVGSILAVRVEIIIVGSHDCISRLNYLFVRPPSGIIGPFAEIMFSCQHTGIRCCCRIPFEVQLDKTRTRAIAGRRDVFQKADLALLSIGPKNQIQLLADRLSAKRRATFDKFQGNSGYRIRHHSIFLKRKNGKQFQPAAFFPFANAPYPAPVFQSEQFRQRVSRHFRFICIQIRQSCCLGRRESTDKQ